MKDFRAAAALLVLAAVLLLAGLRDGQAFETFQKAARVCLECVGIG